MAPRLQMGAREHPSRGATPKHGHRWHPLVGPWCRGGTPRTSWSAPLAAAKIASMTAATQGSTGIARQPATGVFEHAAGLLASAQALEARSGTDRDVRLASEEAELRFGALAAVLDDCRDACILARRSAALGQGDVTAR
jgi:hypothetical protein